MVKIVSLTKGGVQKLIDAAGSFNPASQKMARYDSSGCLSTNTPSFSLDCVNKSYLDTRLAGLGGGGTSPKPYYLKLTSAEPTTGGRVNLPIPDRDKFPWITRTTGAGGGNEYELEAGYAYQVSWSIYGKAYFRSYNLFEDGTGFWNVSSSTGENWKSETVIFWRKNGKPNIWLEHNGWQSGPGRIAVLQITQLRDVFI